VWERAQAEAGDGGDGVKGTRTRTRPRSTAIKLALILPEGEVVTIVADVREYNLSKPLARAGLVQVIDEALGALSVS
jgi:hypothetical protein